MIVLGACCWAWGVLPASAATRTVPGEYTTIEAALAASVTKDSILVAPGTYTEGELWVPSGVKLVGSGLDFTTVNLARLYIRPLTADSAATVVRGFEFNADDDGYHIVQGNAFARLEYNRFVFNGHGGVVLRGGCSFTHNLFIAGYPFSVVGLQVVPNDWTGPANLEIAYNSMLLGEFGLDFSPGDAVLVGDIHHNTFGYQPWPSDLSLYNFVSGSAQLRFSSNIFWGTIVHCLEEPGGSLDFVYNCWWPFHTYDPDACTPPGALDVYNDPLFCNVGFPWDFDWRLQPDSPCIGRGENGTNMGALGVGCSLLATGDVVGAGPHLSVTSHPNPSRGPGAQIGFTLHAAGPVRLTIFDTAGREVRRLLDRTVLGAGKHEVPWSATNAEGSQLPPGVYLLRLETSTEEATRKLTLTN
jgi:hypothetical protein